MVHFPDLQPFEDVDKVRRQEQKQLVSEVNNALVRGKYKWLRSRESPLAESPGYFERMKRFAIRTARAWATKEHVMCSWHYKSRTWARKAAALSPSTNGRTDPSPRAASRSGVIELALRRLEQNQV